MGRGSARHRVRIMFRGVRNTKRERELLGDVCLTWAPRSTLPRITKAPVFTRSHAKGGIEAFGLARGKSTSARADGQSIIGNQRRSSMLELTRFFTLELTPQSMTRSR